MIIPRTAIKAALLPYYGETYMDDVDVVRYADENGTTCARVAVSRPGFVMVTPVENYQEQPQKAFELECAGAAFEAHELPTANDRIN